MKLTVLGKYGPYPAAGGATSSYLVRGENSFIVLDFGSGALGRLSELANVKEARAIVLSHLHYDHICDLLPLSYLLKASGVTLDLVMPLTDCPQRKLIEGLDGFNIVPVCESMRVGEFTLDFTKMRHTLESYSVRTECCGRSLFYSGDTAFCDELVHAAEGSDLMLLDCGKAENAAAAHLSAGEAVFLSGTLGIPAIATHLNPDLKYSISGGKVVLAEERRTYNV